MMNTDLDKADVKSTPARKVFIETWGCQMNVSDSEAMLSLLENNHYESTQAAEDADLVILNTCHIREKATHKVLSRLGELEQIRNANRPHMKVAVAGCVAQAEGQKLLKKGRPIDILIGPGKIHQLPELLKESDATAKGKTVSSLGFLDEKKEKRENSLERVRESIFARESHEGVKPLLAGKNLISRYVTISQGCDNFCTFCVVPRTRGREVSRPLQNILDESQQLLNSGAREITLLGQNVNSYGNDLLKNSSNPDLLAQYQSYETPFVALLDRACKELSGLERLRFTTSNPHDMTQGVASLFFTHPKKMGRYLHLPVQSGSDEILLRMRRKVTRERYLEVVSWFRKQDPAFAISTDLIVGFPGETDADFEETLSLIEEVRFCFSFAFMYSPRKSTPAARYPDQVDETVKKKRLAKLNALQQKITVEDNQLLVGSDQSVLFCYVSEKNPAVLYGRTPCFRLTRLKTNPADAASLVGKTMTVRINDANQIALNAEF